MPKSFEKFLHALNLVPGISYSMLVKLWIAFHDWRFVWERASLEALIASRVGERFAQMLLQKRKSIDIEEAFDFLWQNDIVVLSRDHPEFPPLLKTIPDPPFLLYRKGAPLDSLKQHIAIVGTRRSTFYGEKITSTLAQSIARYDGVVVSGLAFGIDAKAHDACVRLQKPTIAVLASGLFTIMPAAHTQLAERILAAGGTLLSEYPHDLGFHKARYHERNRIISGLSSATLVIEADLKSGALITAHKALEQGREVYALPGDINRTQSRGCLRLIADGAYPIIDIIETMVKLGFDSERPPPYDFNHQESLLFEKLGNMPASTEDLLNLLPFPLEELSSLLTKLELKGVIAKNRSLQWEITSR